MTDELTIPPAVSMTDASADTSSTQYPVEFKGSGAEFFKIWIVNVLLTIVTLSIYAPWAKVRTKRYFYGNTVVDNSSFEYHATGKQIFLGRLIAVVALIAVSLAGIIHPYATFVAYGLIFLLIPWVIWRSLKFNARMSSYRNVRFGFSGTASRIYFIILLLPILILVVGGSLIFGAKTLLPSVFVTIPFLFTIGGILLYSIFHQLLAYYSHNFHRYGTAKFAAPLAKKAFFWIYLKTYLMFFVLIGVLIGIAVFVHSFLGINLDSLFDDPESLEAMLQTPIATASLVAAYALLFLVGAIITAYWRSRIRNYRYNLTSIGGRVNLHSTVKMMPLWWLSVSNFLLLVITIGFAYPWIKVRIARFFARNTTISSNGPLDKFAADEQDKVTSIGSELGDAFDLDLDIGI